MANDNLSNVEWSVIFNWWSRHTTLKKTLIMFGVLSLILSFVVIISFSLRAKSSTNNHNEPLASIAFDLDFSVDPCDDFYRFACGTFENQTKIPNGAHIVNSFTVLNDEVQKQLQTLMSETIDANDPKPFKLVKKLYTQCMHGSIGNHISTIKDRLGIWPIRSSKVFDKNWMETIKKFRTLGFATDSILGIDTLTDVRNLTLQRLHISQPDFGYDREYLTKGLSNEFVQKYYFRHMKDVAIFMGYSNIEYFILELEKTLEETLEFERKLAEISMPKEMLRNSSALYNPMEIRDVQEKYPYIDWVEYLNALLPSPLSIDQNEIIVVMTPSYFEKLGQLLEMTPPLVINNYLTWRAIWTLLQMNGIDLRTHCIETIGQKLPIAVSAMYVRKHFKQDKKEAVLKMEKAISNEFRVILKGADWMDEETRVMALKKVDAMFIRIGYPDMLMDDTKIVEFYKNLEIDESNFLSSILKINKFDIDRSLSKLHSPIEKKDWNMEVPPHGINAGYILEENGLQFPAAILQGVFFSSERPWYVNYGAIGLFIGHEITHGFDDQGRQFNHKGQLINWWKDEAKENFLNRSKCIIDQYGNYTEPLTGLKLNGINSLGENIADLGGIKAAYLAYQQWEKDNGVELKPHGFSNYTSQQMFWISAAQSSCSIETKDYMNIAVTIDVHSPARFRIIGSFSNRKEFANDFQCPEGSPMNPAKKCEVW